MNQTFHLINRETWERSIYFDYYYNQIKCKYTIHAAIDITELIRFKETYHLKFFPTMLYAVIKAVNRNKEFRMSFDENGQLGYWEEVVPSYTLFHAENHTFTDIWSEYNQDFTLFYRQVLADMETYRNVTGVIKARPNQPPNFCPISCLPWLSFTGFSQDTYTESPFLFPLIKFGKYFNQGHQILLPFSVFVSHAVADGYHTCKLINDLQEIVQNSTEWLSVPINQ